jgi:hypothetical protein
MTTDAPSPISGRDFCNVKYTPFTLMFIISSYVCSVAALAGKKDATPAFANTTSRWP